jgi:hypothetical protein
MEGSLPPLGGTINFIYKMVQIPPAISVQAKVHTGNEAAAYLESVVNELAAQGWEFLRVDAIGVQVQPGCLMSLLGQRTTETTYYVITFRRPR